MKRKFIHYLFMAGLILSALQMSVSAEEILSDVMISGEEIIVSEDAEIMEEIITSEETEDSQGIETITEIVPVDSEVVFEVEEIVEVNSSEAEMTVEEKVDELVAQCIASGADTEYKKALWFHDWLINNANYDETYTEYGPEGVLLKGTGVCQSYTDAYALLLNEVGIENSAIISASMEHTWNIAKINGSWTQIDVTWDDPVGGGYEHHQYFGLSDAKMGADHSWENPETYPECFDIVRDEIITLPDPFALSSPVQGINFSLVNSAGNLLTLDNFRTGNTLLMFGRPVCGNTMSFVNGISYLKETLEENGVNVVVVFEDKDQVAQYESTIPFTCVYEVDCGYEKWSYFERIGLSGSFTFPLIVLQDAKGYAHYYSTGYVSEPERVVSTAMQTLNSSGAALTPVQIYLYSNETEMKNQIQTALKNRVTEIRIRNLNSTEFTDADFDAAVNYIETNESKYGASFSGYSYIGPMMTFYVNYAENVHEHSWSSWKVKSKATVFEAETKQRTCSGCGEKQTKSVGSKLTPTVSVNASAVTLKVKQSTTRLVFSGFAEGDSVKSWKSSKSSIFKVSGKPDGTCKLTAKKKAGTATLTVTLESGLVKKIKVTVQNGAVKTKKITNVSKKMTLKKGETFTFQPILNPITSVEKVTYKTSNKKVVTVTAKGKIKAKKKGKAVITIKAGKIKKQCKITVK